MHDLPSQTLLQQSHAQNISGEHLEVMGKKAASRYGSGECETLNVAVVETVKSAGLSPEQVQRVIEFTNQSAYLTEFSKSASSKYVHFEGGPANPSEILKDLNDGGGGTVFDRGVSDYSSPPPLSSKTASLRSRNREALGLEKTAGAIDQRDQALWDAFGDKAPRLEYADPYQDSVALRDKTASARDALNSELGALEVEYMSVTEHLYEQVKEAALSETPLGHILQAWSDITPGEGYVKCAFQVLSPRLLDDQVFASRDELSGSIEKFAAEGAMPNHEHPMLKTFAVFCTQLDKLAEVRAARDEAAEYFNRLDWFLKQAMKKEAADAEATKRKEAAAAASAPLARKGLDVAKTIWSGAKGLAEGASKPAAALATSVAGETAGKAVGAGVKYLPHAAVGLAGKEVYDRGIKYGPGQLPLRYAKSHVPGTREYYVRQYNLQQGMSPM